MKGFLRSPLKKHKKYCVSTNNIEQYVYRMKIRQKVFENWKMKRRDYEMMKNEKNQMTKYRKIPRNREEKRTKSSKNLPNEVQNVTICTFQKPMRLWTQSPFGSITRTLWFAAISLCVIRIENGFAMVQIEVSTVLIHTWRWIHWNSNALQRDVPPKPKESHCIELNLCARCVWSIFQWELQKETAFCVLNVNVIPSTKRSIESKSISLLDEHSI